MCDSELWHGVAAASGSTVPVLQLAEYLRRHLQAFFMVLQRSSQGAALHPHGIGPDLMAVFDASPAVDAYMAEQEADPGSALNSDLGVSVTLAERID